MKKNDGTVVASDGDTHTFWGHLDELRGSLLRIVVATLLCAVAAFCLKGPLFDIVMAPKSPDFITYRLIDWISGGASISDIGLINIELAQQFIIHIRIALWAAILIVSPYILFTLFRFVSPALYSSERRHTLRAVVSGFMLFWAGVLLSYFIVFPLTLQFLGTYQVSSEVPNIISLSSYISVFLMLTFIMGIIFELPVLCWLLGRMGLLKASFMRRYRRHAIVVILIVAAIVTPTGDIFTLTVVSLPIYLLYELGIHVVAKNE